MRTITGTRINWNEKLWRYCTADRFEWIVKNNEIYFASANQFSNPFEGAGAVQTNLPPADPRYAAMDHAERAFFQLKRLTKLNCWHRAEYERDAMWKLYSGESKGVAICSTPSRLRGALRNFRLKPRYGVEQLWGGPVRYIDLTQIRMRVPMLGRFFFKHRAFAWEREFRLAISVRDAEEFGVAVPARGIRVPVNLDMLVDHIIIGFEIPGRQRSRVAALARTAGLDDRLRFSSLLGKPRFI